MNDRPPPPSLDRWHRVRLCSSAAAALGLPDSVALDFVRRLDAGPALPLVWFSSPACGKCGAAVFDRAPRDVAPLLGELVTIRLRRPPPATDDEAAAIAIRDAIEPPFLLVVEGPGPDGAGEPAGALVEEAMTRADGVLLLGSCPSLADRRPSGLASERWAHLPGCPPDPILFLAALLLFAARGSFDTRAD